MELQLVASSSIAAIGYDSETRTLAVQFMRSGETYFYRDVPEAEFRDLLECTSGMGRHFNSFIRARYEMSRTMPSPEQPEQPADG